MCCFSRPVKVVKDTNIFARMAPEARQILSYSMHLEAKVDLAMILPIPVKAGSDEKAVEFINLEKYPKMFDDMANGFLMDGPFGDRAPLRSKSEAPKALAVQRVGSFDASFVPTVADFARLDESFRLPAGTWDKLPLYKDYGFVVFKFRPCATRVHPMAFSFPTRDTARLFFPTVHIHDGKIHEQATFHHSLFCQAAGKAGGDLLHWMESSALASSFMKPDLTAGVVVGNRHIFRRIIEGKQKNEDVWISRKEA